MGGEKRGGGFAILINHVMSYRIKRVLDCRGKIEACVVEILLAGESIILVACYKPPNLGSISDEEWLRFFNQFDRPGISTPTTPIGALRIIAP